MRVAKSFAVLLALMLTVGCGIKEQTEGLKSTSKQLKQDLKNLQTRNAVDLETQMMLAAVYKAYTSCLQQNQAAPTKWPDLAAAPGLNADERDQIRSASRLLTDIIWGAELKGLEQEGKANAKLASMENNLLGNVVILQANGELNMVSRNEARLIPIAE